MRNRVAVLGLVLLMGAPTVEAGIFGGLFHKKSKFPHAASPIFDQGVHNDRGTRIDTRSPKKLRDIEWGAQWKQLLFGRSHNDEMRHYLMSE